MSPTFKKWVFTLALAAVICLIGSKIPALEAADADITGFGWVLYLSTVLMVSIVSVAAKSYIIGFLGLDKKSVLISLANKAAFWLVVPISLCIAEKISPSNVTYVSGLGWVCMAVIGWSFSSLDDWNRARIDRNSLAS